LFRQLSALEFAERDGGTVHLAVRERARHDDLAMACVSRCIPRVVWYARAVGSPTGGALRASGVVSSRGEDAVVWSRCWLMPRFFG
jgi:hypothetical protein